MCFIIPESIYGSNEFEQNVEWTQVTRCKKRMGGVKEIPTQGKVRILCVFSYVYAVHCRIIVTPFKQGRI